MQSSNFSFLRSLGKCFDLSFTRKHSKRTRKARKQRLFRSLTLCKATFSAQTHPNWCYLCSPKAFDNPWKCLPVSPFYTVKVKGKFVFKSLSSFRYFVLVFVSAVEVGNTFWTFRNSKMRSYKKYNLRILIFQIKVRS